MGDWTDKSGIAENPNAPIEILVKLSKNRCPDIKLKVAKNPNTPTEVLVKLIKYNKNNRDIIAEAAKEQLIKRIDNLSKG